MSNALYVAWRSGTPERGRWEPVGLLEHQHGLFRFRYTHGARLLVGFHPFPGLPDLECVYESEELFPIFANRMLSESRPEYEAFLRWGGFDPSQPPEPLSLLGVTGGIRQTDSLEVFPCPRPDVDGAYRTRFFLHGLRWFAEDAIKRAERLVPGERLGMMLDVNNAYDPFAVAVRTLDDRDRYLIGYVPRYLARDIGTLCLSCSSEYSQLTVSRVNASAPLQMKVLCELRACWPEGFEPCSGEAYQPIVPARWSGQGSNGARTAS